MKYSIRYLSTKPRFSFLEIPIPNSGGTASLALLLLFFYSSFIHHHFSFSQERGWPFLRNYTPKEYGGSSLTFASLQDKKSGLMYFGLEGTGLVSYDGMRWQHIHTPNNTLVHSLAQDEKGDIYVAAIDNFGMLKTGTQGQTEYSDLTFMLPDSVRGKIGSVWSVKTTRDAVYFQTMFALYLYFPEKKKITSIPVGGMGNFMGSFVHKNEYYIQATEGGLFKVENQQLIAGRQQDFWGCSDMTKAKIPKIMRKVLSASCAGRI